MAFTKTDEKKRKFYQGAVLLGILAAPFTGGLSLIATAGSLVASRKYNLVLQTEKEGMEQEVYYEIKDIKKQVQNFKTRENSFSNSLKNIEYRTREGGIKIK